MLDILGDHGRSAISALAVTPRRAFALETPRVIRDTWRLHVVDVSDPGAMVLLGEQYEWAGPLAAADDMVLQAAGAIGLRTLAEAEQGTGIIVAETRRIHTLGSPMGVAIDEGHAYAADTDTELWVLDISDPAAPRYLSRFDRPPGASLDGWNVAGVDVTGRTAWLAALDNGGVAVDLSEPLHLAPPASQAAR